MSTPTKAILSSGEKVAPTREAWMKELEWRANYTGETVLEHAIDEILRMRTTLVQVTTAEIMQSEPMKELINEAVQAGVKSIQERIQK